MSDRDNILPIAGRQSRPRYTEDFARRVEELVREGRTVREIAPLVGVSYTFLMKQVREHPSFAERLAVARREAVRASRRSSKGPGVGGRSDAKVAAILASVEQGVSRSHAAAMAGVHHETWGRWLAEDEELERQLMEAEGRLQEDRLAVVRRAEQGWQAAAWLLERRFPKTYALQREVPHAERVRTAKAIGTDLTDHLVRGLAEAELSVEQQELIRKTLVQALEKVAG